MSSSIESRRNFLKTTGIGSVAAVGSAASLLTENANAAQIQAVGITVLPYPTKAVSKAGAMPINTPVAFNYPDADSPCVAIKMGEKTNGGVGPNGDIVAYSTLCTHMGCPVNYDTQNRVFKCPCHFSQFDSQNLGQMVCGQATENLPRITLNYDSKTDAISAVAVTGLIYGRAANII
jgi:arsenite oxidase small subunit